MSEKSSPKSDAITDRFVCGQPDSEPKTPKEELYIGCKIIKAIPMTSDDFKKFKGQEIGMEENAPGYKVEYEDGYVSWSPAWTFENAYRKLSNGERKLLSV